MTESSRSPIRVLVADDSEAVQRGLTELLRSDGAVVVVGRASDGEEALRSVIHLKPDCVLLDLEMPRMDGFTFLRLLMARQPTPVIVVSSNSRKQDVFKALELGALEFVAKPEAGGGDLASIREDLLAKLLLVRGLRTGALDPPARPATPPGTPPPGTLPAATPLPGSMPAVVLPPRPVPPAASSNAPPAPAAAPPEAARAPASPPGASPSGTPVPGAPGRPGLATVPPPRPRRAARLTRLVVVGASTGGPAALTRLLAGFPRDLPLGWAIAQHMPERFTRAFADRLARTTGHDVREAEEGSELADGRVLVAPGGKHLRLSRPGGSLSPLVAALTEATGEAARYCPSIDLLFESAAAEMGARVCGVVLTGMGSDGKRGVARVKDAGGVTLAQSEGSAVIYGMPREAAGTGKLDALLDLDAIGERLRRFAEDGA